MSKYAILRTQKIKHLASLGRSLKHSFREQETPNADPQKEAENVHIGASSSAEALAAFKARLPEKRRKDAVLAVEYLITASPEAMQSKDRAAQSRYFEDSLEWLKERHGSENVVYSGIHRDETTPHMYCYVVPLDQETGRLNAKKWLGGKNALAQMQTEFVHQVGQHHGLERGLERSKARHQTVRQFYSQVNRIAAEADQHQIVIAPEVVTPRTLKKGVFTTTVESPGVVAARASREATTQAKELISTASISAQERQRATDTRKRLAQLQEPFRGLSRAQEAEVLKVAKEIQKENEKQQEIRKQKIRERDQAKRERRQERGRGFSR